MEEARAGAADLGPFELHERIIGLPVRAVDVAPLDGPCMAILGNKGIGRIGAQTQHLAGEVTPPRAILKAASAPTPARCVTHVQADGG